MTPPICALYVTCLLLGRITHVTALDTSSSLRVATVNVGEDVTLESYYDDKAQVIVDWYKQTLGQKVKLMYKFYKYKNENKFYDEFKNDPRFQVENSSGKNHLKISGVQISDMATYFCMSYNSFTVNFSAITLNVKGSGVNVPVWVHQSTSESMELGGSETLNCTVHTGTCGDGEHSVYWFKDSEKSHPGLIYTHGGRNDQCVRNRDTQTHTCVYNLPMKTLNLSHAGTYYCAVASCGRILFGNGTKLDFKGCADNVDSPVLVYILSTALVFTIILVVFLSYTLYRVSKTNSCQYTDSHARPSTPAASAPNTEDSQDVHDLHYAALRENKVGRPRRQREDSGNDCVYSSVRQ